MTFFNFIFHSIAIFFKILLFALGIIGAIILIVIIIVLINMFRFYRHNKINVKFKSSAQPKAKTSAKPSKTTKAKYPSATSSPIDIEFSSSKSKVSKNLKTINRILPTKDATFTQE